MTRLVYDTDRLILGTAVAKQLAEAAVVGDCRLYPRSQVAVDLRGGGGRAAVETQRVAWALAHPESHVGVDEEVCHTCGNAGEPTHATGGARRDVCIAPAHLVKR